MSAIHKLRSSVQRRLMFLLAGLFVVAGLAWFFWVWATVSHQPLEVLTYGWPTPVLISLGILLATDGTKRIRKPT